ncbi:hypothetical protein GGP91_000200 [Salinibacter ruber]|uniref:Uncharacterized protein n=1 Tax=Salinibacter ruber TaxID=146919 RepID=A0A9X2V667_9BACT|nr:hypothetical protein [Salinibacter ruber]MCS4099444.1 hypothetical protein [Salinibacter ruber]MCS4101827.1 hypothetical protein [Salinibacter ruber]MCS4122076.1 hypothetical protein [Salinibacter ruber]MCS4159756.1 hypothetical protein [Salinibacter ruber]
MLVGASPTRRAQKQGRRFPARGSPQSLLTDRPHGKRICQRLHPGWTLALVSATIGSRRQAPPVLRTTSDEARERHS